MTDATSGVEPVPALPDGLDPEVARWLELGEARYLRDAHGAAAAAEPGNPMGFGVAEIGGAIAASMAGLDFFFFNRAVGVGLEQAATREVVDALLGYYRGLGITKEAVQVAHGTQPPELTSWLVDGGLVMGSRWVKMWHDLVDLAPRMRFRRIERVGPEQAEAYGEVVMAAFGMPGPARPLATSIVGLPDWRHYIGYEDGTPVAVGATRIEDGVAWLGFGGTLEAHRGRGWQTAMFLARLNDAKDEGCRFAVTETGEETATNPVNHSYRNMVKVGFQLGYARRNWYRT